MLNRFNGCKSLEDLYARFNPETSNYSNVSVDELETIAEVFRAHVEEREMPDVPLTDKGYTYIWNYVVDTIEEQEEDAMTKNVTINDASQKEEKIMTVKNNVDKAVQEMMDKFQEAKENIKVQAGETYEEFIDKTDESVNTMKEAFGNTLGVLDNLLGYSVLKNSILEMMEASMENGSKKDLFKMAKKCRELIEAEIANLEFWGDQESFKKAVQLKALTEGDRGKSIFESLVSGVIWVAKKVARKLRKWFNVDEEKSIINSICKGIGAFAKVLKAGLKIAFNAVKFAASFVVSGVVILCSWIYNAIKLVVTKIKGWITKKDEVIEDDFDFEDDDIFEEEVIPGTSLA